MQGLEGFDAVAAAPRPQQDPGWSYDDAIEKRVAAEVAEFIGL